MEAYDRIGKTVISVGKKDQKGLIQMHYMAVKRVE